MFRVLTLACAAVIIFAGIATIIPFLEHDDLSGVVQLATVNVAEPAFLGNTSEIPSCIISVHPDVIQSGEEISVAWVSENASAAALSGVGLVPVRGGMFSAPIRSSVYMLTVRSFSGEYASCNTQVDVL